MRIKLLQLIVRAKNWLLGLFRPNHLERELEIEMESHLRFARERFEEEGMSQEEARKAAARGFGNVEFLKEECRDSWGMRLFSDFRRDLKFGFGQLRKHKSFTVVAVLTLTLGIGANLTIFSFVNALLLKPLPYPDSERFAEF